MFVVQKNIFIIYETILKKNLKVFILTWISVHDADVCCWLDFVCLVIVMTQI